MVRNDGPFILGDCRRSPSGRFNEKILLEALQEFEINNLMRPPPFIEG